MKTPPKILLVEDSENDRDLIKLGLNQGFDGLEIIEVLCPKDFETAVSQGDFDIVITDYNIGWTDGITILKTIKAKYPECPVIMMTVMDTEEVAVNAMKAGLDDYLVKSPSQFARLADIVRQTLENKAQEMALREAEVLNNTIIESVQEGVVVFDRELRYVVWNPFMEQLSGVSAAELIGKNIKDVSPALVGEKIVPLLMKVLEGESVRSSDIPYYHPESETTGWVEGWYGPLVSGSGEVIGVVGTIHDVTQRKENEAEREKFLTAELQRAREFASLSTTATTISSNLDIQNVLKVVAKELTQLLSLDSCAISSWDPDNETVTLLVETLPPGRKTSPEWLGPTDVNPWPVAHEVLLTGQPAQMNIHDADLLQTSKDYLEEQGIKSLLMVALIAHDKTIGLVELEDFDLVRDFSEQEIGLAQMLCNQAAVALENARLFEATRRQVDELRALHTIATFAQDNPDENEYITFVTQLISETFYPYNFGMLILDQREEFLLRHPSYIESGKNKKILSVKEGITGKVATSGSLINLPDVSKSPDYLPCDGGTRAEICVPIKIGERVVGVINAESTDFNAFNQSDERFLESLAGQVSVALENARLYEELEDSFVQTVFALANAMDLRDSYTADHSERMAGLAEELGRLMGCSEEEIGTLHWAALLHDIGKIGVPDEILLKPGPLTPEEYEIIKQHPGQGARIVEPVEKLRHVAPIIRHHQEKFDGTGYPDGLKGKEIPLVARILMVVDAYVAMTDGRVYRSARSHEEALREINDFSGRQFDPEVVEVFAGVFELMENSEASESDHLD